MNWFIIDSVPLRLRVLFQVDTAFGAKTRGSFFLLLFEELMESWRFAFWDVRQFTGWRASRNYRLFIVCKRRATINTKFVLLFTYFPQFPQSLLTFASAMLKVCICCVLSPSAETCSCSTQAFQICFCVFEFVFVFSNLFLCFRICFCVFEFVILICFQICFCVDIFGSPYETKRKPKFLVIPFIIVLCRCTCRAEVVH